MDKINVRIRVYGIVQGVGFRPFVSRMARNKHVYGWVRNTAYGAEIEAEGSTVDVHDFREALEREAPPLSFIENIELDEGGALEQYDSFDILESSGTDDTGGNLTSVGGDRREPAVPRSMRIRKNTLISPDICVCGDCLRELFETSDRRYKYPFINCTNCGPRFTIIKDIPYDRKNTSMSAFPMCPDCAGEYADINNRRFHAQPDCCGNCGPSYSYVRLSGNLRCEPADCGADSITQVDGLSDVSRSSDCGSGGGIDAISQAALDIADGKIIAIKGLGGFHLCCRSDIPELAARLRERKHRDYKPFALMCRDISAAAGICSINDDEMRILSSKSRPIVLLRKKVKSGMEWVSRNGRIGVMLPYTPMHFLLFDAGCPDTVIMTSANISERPLIYEDDKAVSGLCGIADAVLVSNREIVTRCDDSVLWEFEGHEYFARRSRGYVPLPVLLPVMPHTNVLACGAEQKASFTITKGRHAFVSQHVGDLKNFETFEFYEEQAANFERLFEIKPELIACDIHPDYMSAGFAEENAVKLKVPVVRVQHHHAHMASCMADNGLTWDDSLLGIIWDGTGLGDDGTIWGGEMLYGGYEQYTRVGSIRPIRLPGGDSCMRDIWRVALSLLDDSGIDINNINSSSRMPHLSLTKTETVAGMLKANVNSPVSSGMGRLFDGVSALLGICTEAGYEGEGAVLLEAAGERYTRGTAGKESVMYGKIYFPYTLYEENGVLRLDWRPMVREIAGKMQTACESGRDGRVDICADTGNNTGDYVDAMAAMFMNTLIYAATEMSVKLSARLGFDGIVLSGGTFQNMYLLCGLKRRLEENGFKVYTHRQVSCNDEGLSLGQAMAALARQHHRGE